MFDKFKDRALQRRIKQHVIGKDHLYFAVVYPGFEETLRSEMREFGLFPTDGKIEGGVEFNASLDDALRFALLTRTSSKIIMRLGSFKAYDYFILEREILNFPWELFLHPYSPVKFRSSSVKSKIYHTGKLEEIVLNKITERLKLNSSDESVEELNDETETLLIMRNIKNLVSVSIDLSGPDLHKRGIRKNIVNAPLRETLAALILRESKIKEYDLIIDPMCGSGTFSLEAYGIMNSLIPSIDRIFPFMYWPAFKEKRFNHMKGKLELEKSKAKFKLLTSDIDERAVDITKSNLPVNYKEAINPELKSIFDYTSDDISDKTLIVLNPPYGKRIESDNPVDFYRKLGRKLNGDLASASVAIIVPGLEFQKALGMKFQRKILFKNGGIPSALLIREV